MAKIYRAEVNGQKKLNCQITMATLEQSDQKMPEIIAK